MITVDTTPFTAGCEHEIEVAVSLRDSLTRSLDTEMGAELFHVLGGLRLSIKAVGAVVYVEVESLIKRRCSLRFGIERLPYYDSEGEHGGYDFTLPVLPVTADGHIDEQMHEKVTTANALFPQRLENTPTVAEAMAAVRLWSEVREELFNQELTP